MSEPGKRWIEVEAERTLYIDRGREVILCDRCHPAGTLLLLVNAESAERLMADLMRIAKCEI